MEYSVNLIWLLNALSCADGDDINGGSFEAYGEDEQGNEGCSEIEISKLAKVAANRIIELEHKIKLLGEENKNLSN